MIMNNYDLGNSSPARILSYACKNERSM